MTAFQSTLNTFQGFGVIGEFAFDGPRRVKTINISSADAANNVIGRYFTYADPAVEEVSAGGTGVIGGILTGPKEYALAGTAAGGTLAASLTLPNDTLGELCQMGEVVVALPAAANIGDKVTYATATGVLGSVAALASFTGVIAVTTGVLTVTGLGTTEYLEVGSALSGTGVPGGTVVTAQLTGTAGKDGTYQTNIITAVASTTMTAPNSALAAAAGSAFVPNAIVWNYAADAVGAQLAVIKLTN